MQGYCELSSLLSVHPSGVMYRQAEHSAMLHTIQCSLLALSIALRQVITGTACYQVVECVQASQKMTNSLMLATCMMNIGTLFSVSAMASAATASFVGASAFGLISLINFAKVQTLLWRCP